MSVYVSLVKGSEFLYNLFSAANNPSAWIIAWREKQKCFFLLSYFIYLEWSKLVLSA